MLHAQVNNQHTFSITSRASFIGFAMHLTADTAPESKFFPSMIMASISTSPFSFKTDPQPKHKSRKKIGGKRKIRKSLRTNHPDDSILSSHQATFLFPTLLTYQKYLPKTKQQKHC